MIQMWVRLGRPSWEEVLAHVAKNKAELRRAYHNLQRCRQ